VHRVSTRQTSGGTRRISGVHPPNVTSRLQVNSIFFSSFASLCGDMSVVRVIFENTAENMETHQP
jgi:hypothetical protein